MKSSDLGFAVECALKAGWMNSTKYEFKVSLAYDPNGCFIMEEDGLRLGLCMATNYGRFGFIGNLLVIKEMRGRGIGHQLLACAVEYLHRCGTTNVLLDGVPAALSLYERMGFTRICRSMRFSGEIKGWRSQEVRAIRAEDLETIHQMDQEIFGADRRFFLEHDWELHPDFAKVLERDGEIMGFIMGRRRRDVVWAGPWVVRQGAEGANQLLQGLAVEAGGRQINMAALETNAIALEIIRSLGMIETRNPSWRMSLGSLGRAAMSDEYYAIASGARG